MSFNDSYRRVLSKLGYYDYQHGFILRHVNQEEGWNSHLEKCRNFILESVKIYKPDKITVLGSGWLLELPLKELLEQVNKVLLVDIIHPPEVISQVSQLKQVELICDDVSGGLIDNVWKQTAELSFFRKLETLEKIIIPEYKPAYDPGMIISLNILSQLEVLPLKYLLKRSKTGTEEIDAFRESIQRKHIDFLKKHKSVLITDVAEIFTDSGGEVTEKKTVITELPAGILKNSWTWDFDLKRSDFYRKRSVLKVEAIVI